MTGKQDRPSTETDAATQGLGAAAREAVERGAHVREEVRSLTTAALTGGRLDTDRARRVVDAVMAGISEAAASGTGRAREHAGEAAKGVDDALAHAAQALQLTAAEARDRVESFGEEDLRKAREDLRILEALLRDSVSRLASTGDAMVREVWRDLEQHWHASGTEVGRQASRALGDATENLRRAAEAQLAAGWDAALGASAQIADVASGVLAGLADALGEARDKRPGRDERPPPREP